jgi:diaminopimelate epimerase
MLRFLKMHGVGNDFVVVDARAGALGLTPALIAALADRRTGIGCDQFITLEQPRAGADVFMRIHNADGTEAAACGNATRCVARLLGAETGRDTITVETLAGTLSARLAGGLVEVDMGVPRTAWPEIPLAWEEDTLRLSIEGHPAAVNMGNPHATLFVDDIAPATVEGLGSELEYHPIFPDRANIGFATVLAPDRLRLRVWERGAGLTRACGTGACAAAVNAARRGLTGRHVAVVLDGGTLDIVWRDDDRVLMAGPAMTAFAGEVDPAAYAT